MWSRSRPARVGATVAPGNLDRVGVAVKRLRIPRSWSNRGHPSCQTQQTGVFSGSSLVVGRAERPVLMRGQSQPMKSISPLFGGGGCGLRGASPLPPLTSCFGFKSRSSSFDFFFSLPSGRSCSVAMVRSPDFSSPVTYQIIGLASADWIMPELNASSKIARIPRGSSLVGSV